MTPSFKALVDPQDKSGIRIHFIGIGGIGMSGIAHVLLDRGYAVSGSDAMESDTVRGLRLRGASVHIGHRSENVGDASVVVVSSAVRPSNPEWVEARLRRIPVVPRAEMLGELMRGKIGLAVAGTHGKTTTTSMLATILAHAGLDPTLVIGGKVDRFGGNAKLGQGELVVAEADESDGSFLHLPATFAIITNIDNDHLDHFGSLAGVEQAFVDFIGKLPFYGQAVVCGDDEGIRRCLDRFGKPFTTYGFGELNDWIIRDWNADAAGSGFTLVRRRAPAGGGGVEESLGTVKLPVPGRHNVLNATSALVLSLRLGLSFETAVDGLAAFGGVRRRFELRWKSADGRRRIVDDYGHHPTEIAATLAAARQAWPTGRIRVIFQPHRYSRTLHCRDGFLNVFRETEDLALLPIYSAGEEPIEGVTSERLLEALQSLARPGQRLRCFDSLEAAAEATMEDFRDGDLVLCMGAGSITKLPDLLVARLSPDANAERLSP